MHIYEGKRESERTEKEDWPQNKFTRPTFTLIQSNCKISMTND